MTLNAGDRDFSNIALRSTYSIILKGLWHLGSIQPMDNGRDISLLEIHLRLSYTSNRTGFDINHRQHSLIGGNLTTYHHLTASVRNPDFLDLSLPFCSHPGALLFRLLRSMLIALPRAPSLLSPIFEAIIALAILLADFRAQRCAKEILSRMIFLRAASRR